MDAGRVERPYHCRGRTSGGLPAPPLNTRLLRLQRHASAQVAAASRSFKLQMPLQTVPPSRPWSRYEPRPNKANRGKFRSRTTPLGPRSPPGTSDFLGGEFGDRRSLFAALLMRNPLLRSSSPRCQCGWVRAVRLNAAGRRQQQRAGTRLVVGRFFRDLAGASFTAHRPADTMRFIRMRHFATNLLLRSDAGFNSHWRGSPHFETELNPNDARQTSGYQWAANAAIRAPVDDGFQTSLRWGSDRMSFTLPGPPGQVSSISPGHHHGGRDARAHPLSASQGALIELPEQLGPAAAPSVNWVLVQVLSWNFSFAASDA